MSAWLFRCAVWLYDSLRKRKPGCYYAKEGRLAICFYHSEPKVCRDKKRHLVGGPFQHGKRGNGSLYGFTGQGTSLGVQRHAAVVDAHAFRPPQHDIEYARARGTVVQGVHC